MIEWGDFGKKHLDFILRPIKEDFRINILEGSVRSGKTVAMIPKWLNYIQNGAKGLLIMTGVSKDTIYDNVLSDLFDTVGSSNYKYNRQTGDLTIYWHENSARKSRRIKVLGAKDEGSEKFLRGKTLAGAYCDEVSLMPRTFFAQLLNRLSVENAKLYATTNPDAPFHFLYEEYISDDSQNRQNGIVDVLHFELEDNPNLSNEYKTFIKNAYSGLWYKRMILGLWVMADGAVYPEWNDALFFDDKEFEDSGVKFGRKIISVDYGTINPCVFLEIYDYNNVLWIRREYYHDSKKTGIQKTDSEYYKDLKAFVEEDTARIVVDPSASSFKAELKKNGLFVRDAKNIVLEGIRYTSGMLKNGRIRVHKENCKNLVREFESYVWDDKARLRGVEQPLKMNDHAMDALRYAVMEKEKREGVSILR